MINRSRRLTLACDCFLRMSVCVCSWGQRGDHRGDHTVSAAAGHPRQRSLLPAQEGEDPLWTLRETGDVSTVSSTLMMSTEGQSSNISFMDMSRDILHIVNKSQKKTKTKHACIVIKSVSVYPKPDILFLSGQELVQNLLTQKLTFTVLLLYIITCVWKQPQHANYSWVVFAESLFIVLFWKIWEEQTDWGEVENN